MTLASDGLRLFFVTEHYPAIIWDLAGNERQRFFGHQDKATISVFSSDGRSVFSAGTEKTIYKWDAQTGRMLQTFAGHRGRVIGLCVTPNDRLLISADSEELKMWGIDNGELIASWTMVSDTDHAIYTPDNLFSVSDPESIQMYERMINRELEPMSDAARLRRATYRFVDHQEIAERIRSLLVK